MPGPGAQHPREHARQGGLSRAVGPDHDQHAARQQLQSDPIQQRAGARRQPPVLPSPDSCGDPALVDPGEGPGQLDRVLDVLARVDFTPTAPFPVPPVDPTACILVSVDGAPGFGSAVVVGRQAVFVDPFLHGEPPDEEAA